MAAVQEQPSCCPEGSIGPVSPSSDPLSGKVVSIPRQNQEKGQLEMYVVEPEGGATKVVIVGHDVFGVDSGRTKLICDRISAELGVLVVLPSFFQGGAGGEETAKNFASFFAPYKEEGKEEEDSFFDKAGKFFKGVLSAPSFVMGISNLKWAEVEAELVNGVFPFVKEKGITDIGVLGFCWGGWFITHASSLDGVVCGASFHPSLQVCDMVGENAKEVCELVKCPQMLLAAENDKDEVKAGGLANTIYATKPFGKDCVFKTFNHMQHGWVNRGDLGDPTVKSDVEDAIVMVLDFYKKWLVNNDL